jgi:putative transposase
MSTYTQILYQVVFSTKHRNPQLIQPARTEVFKSMYGILTNKNCHVYRIGGIEDHIHLVFSLHPTIALANLIKDIKLGSISCIKENKLITNFVGWQEGYAAFTYSIDAKDNLIEYVKNQEEHHNNNKHTFIDELKSLLKDFKIDYDEKYLL